MVCVHACLGEYFCACSIKAGRQSTASIVQNSIDSMKQQVNCLHFLSKNMFYVLKTNVEESDLVSMELHGMVRNRFIVYQILYCGERSIHG